MPPFPPLLAAALAAALALPAIASPRDGQTTAAAAAAKTVKVVDNRFAPKRLTIAKGTRVKWVWASNSESPHDVYLNRRPAGAKRFQSPVATAPFSFARKLRKPGAYKFLCSVHENMRMRIDVSR